MTAPLLLPEHLAKLHAGKDLPAPLSAQKIGRMWARLCVDYAGLTPAMRVLDIGSGAGRVAIAVAEQFDFANSYLGVEIDRESVDFCNAALGAGHPHFRFVQADIRSTEYNPGGAVAALDYRFPSADGSIDFCLAVSLFTHMFAAETAHYLCECRRVLAPGGRLLSTWYCIDDVAQRRIDTLTPKFRFGHDNGDGTLSAYPARAGKVVAHTGPAIERMFGAAGFSHWQFFRGNWAGEREGPHGQDAFVAFV
jgi:SAM-dependent methyltransferase